MSDGIPVRTGISRRGGKKQRKFGRKGRRPGHNRYNTEQRWIANKVKRLTRAAKREAKLQVLRDKRLAA